MTEDRKLLVGVDFCDDVTQISCFREDLEDVIPIGRVTGKQREYECPTVLSYDPEKKEWLFGSEALQAARHDGVKLFQRLPGQIAIYNEVVADGMKLSAVDALVRFFVKLLSWLNEYFPNETIQKLVVTVFESNDNLKRALKEALGQIGIGEDRLVVQAHQQSYMYYALGQKKELWMNDVGLFEFTRDGLFYSQIHIDRRNIPYIVGVKRVDLSENINWEMMEQEESFRLEYAFVNLANIQMYKQTVTTIYVTGEGFQGEWADGALTQLCNGRRVFRGNNLFTKGACYAARELSGQGVMKDFLFLDEEMTYTNVSMRIYHDAKMQEIVLARAGMPWKDVDSSVDVIPDHEEEIQLTIQNVLRHETKVHLLSLEGFDDRPNKMTRFTIRLRYADAAHCIVTLKDNGFGEFCPSSNRIWERYLEI